MESSLGAAIAATVVIWAVSSALSLSSGLLFMAGCASPRRWLRFTATVAVNVTRGIPTSLLVVCAGLAMLRLSGRSLMIVFPGTPGSFQLLAWALALSIALGGAGHFAEIFRAAHAALGDARREQATLLGFSRCQKLVLIGREAAVIALPPTGTRLVHQLHNTAFVSFFPVVDLFGFVQTRASETFAVSTYLLLGCLVYVILSALIWSSTRGLEMALGQRAARLPRAELVPA